MTTTTPRFLALLTLAVLLAVVGLAVESDVPAMAATAKKPPVVLILMDEFPVDQMLNSAGRIDPVRYPNFAALAATGTWFKNASTTYDSTTHAIPEILDAKLPSAAAGPTYRSHPASVYTLFGRRGYRVVDSEEATSICPPRYCPHARSSRPAILPFLQKGRRERLERFFSQIKPGRPTLYVKHILLPHGPYLFLPSGKQTRLSFRDPLPGMNGPVGFGDPFLTEHNQQRLQLQIGYADHELGRLFARMRANGTFNKALIAVTADHGISFEVGVKDRRTVTPGNIDEVAPVPMFVKRPGQTKGSTSSVYARTIDLVPTIADILHMPMYGGADGHSAFSRAVRGRRFVRMINRNFRGTITVSAKHMEARRRALIRRKVALFGQGDIASLYTGIGPNRLLLGKASALLRPAGLGKIRSTIINGAAMRLVNPRSVVHATQVAGSITGGTKGSQRDLAVAVNGRIEAVGSSFHLRGSSKEDYAMMVPELALRPGRNVVDLYEVTGKGTKLQLIARA
jgi:Sulfatase